MKVGVLMVCEGNLCRSPMGMALLAHAMPSLNVQSAGTHTSGGRAADPLAMQLIEARGLDLRTHVSTLIDEDRVRRSRLILTMTRDQRNAVHARFPFSQGKVHRLGEHEGIDIVDPFRHGRFIFELAMIQIEQGISRWLDPIARLSY
ncbi:low molecular weight phosphotyrosine protein phosphatase [Paraburkholderia sp.]|uniref:arsenate reductase/protein-tyrosine-phosphatase family protein n=1 Tax=Paraburkholderia sp. TaxID=1926495 RepID=UPI002381DF4B|nr:low molecular weight phosphotyrosine protein phosphatase [Paraburkholderia sp.]MDE1179741.1 low molecular weight phosphotyrosine protein phosphatase [Paraburkholderia sp.]